MGVLINIFLHEDKILIHHAQERMNGPAENLNETLFRSSRNSKKGMKLNFSVLYAFKEKKTETIGRKIF